MALAACATPAPPVPTVKTCPAITSYTPAQEAQASAELKALPAGDILGVFITDYSQLRAEVRACQAG